MNTTMKKTWEKTIQAKTIDDKRRPEENDSGKKTRNDNKKSWKNNPGKEPDMTTNNKHLRPELRRETSALWKVPHNRAYTKIINEH